MEDNQGFKFLKEAFAKFAAKYDAADAGGRVVRSLAAGGKAAVDRGLQEFPKTYLSQVAKDLYTLLTSQELSDSISSTVRSFDEEKVKALTDNIINNLKDRETALNVAKKLKEALNKFSATDILGQVEGLTDMANVPQQYRIVLQVMLSQFKPILDDMKFKSEEEIADQLTELADQIPSDLIATSIANATRNVTPEKISKQTSDLVGKLPSPQAVADIVHGVGGVISQHLDLVTQTNTPAEVPAILRDLADNAGQLVSDTLSNDNASKTNFNKKGKKGGYKF